MIRPLSPGDIVAFPYLDAVGRYTGDDTLDAFEWYAPPSGPLSTARLSTAGETDTMLDSGEIVIIATGFESVTAYDAYRTYGECDPRLVSPGGAPSTSQFELRAERGSGARERVNGFLKHPSVAYQHDPVTRPFRLALTATYRGRDVAMAVLGHPSGRHNADGRTLELYRFAAHPDRPANTGSWLLARCCRWAKLEGYDRLLTYAGIQNNNDGTMYRAAGFEHLETTTADLSQWQSRSGRTGGGTYRKRRYERRLAGHGIEARRPAGRVDDEQTRLTDRSTAVATACAAHRLPGRPRRDRGIAQNALIQTREEIPGRRTASLSSDAQGLLAEHGAVNDDGDERSDDTPLVACFGARTSEDALVAVLCVRDHSGEQNPRDNTGALTLSSMAAQTDTLAYPVNVVRGLIADACEWALLHGYATVDSHLDGAVATAALEGVAFPVDGHPDPAVAPSVGPSRTPSSA